MLTKLLPNGQKVGIVLLTGKNLFGDCEVIGKTSREHQAMTLTDVSLKLLVPPVFLVKPINPVSSHWHLHNYKMNDYDTRKSI